MDIFTRAHIHILLMGGHRQSDGINACLRADWIFHFALAERKFIQYVCAWREKSESAQKRCFRMEIDGARKSNHTLGVHIYGIRFKFWNMFSGQRYWNNFSSNMHEEATVHSWINHTPPLSIDWFRANTGKRLSE